MLSPLVSFSDIFCNIYSSLGGKTDEKKICVPQNRYNNKIHELQVCFENGKC